MYRTQDLHVKEIVPLLSPRALKALSPTPVPTNDAVAQARERVIRILKQEDPRMLVVIGPCSIHDVAGALEYAGRLDALRRELADHLEIVMRVYFEKPRTTIGWKGLINDPGLDNTHDIEAGLKKARGMERLEAVPDAEDGLDVLVREPAQLLAQPAHVDVERARANLRAVAPNAHQ